MSEAIFWPMISQAALTSIVAWRMYRRRIAEIRGRRIHPQSLATRQQAGGVLQDVTAADNFQNLFEMPVLFFAVCLALAITGLVSQLQVILAWSYVAARVVHSYIHLTDNRVVRRLAVFMASNVLLIGMWLLFAISLATRDS